MDGGFRLWSLFSAAHRGEVKEMPLALPQFPQLPSECRMTCLKGTLTGFNTVCLSPPRPMEPSWTALRCLR